jgi:hypothetical protein
MLEEFGHGCPGPKDLLVGRRWPWPAYALGRKEYSPVIGLGHFRRTASS